MMIGNAVRGSLLPATVLLGAPLWRPSWLTTSSPSMSRALATWLLLDGIFHRGMADSGHDNQDHAAGTEAPLGDFAFRLESCLHLFAFFLDKKFAAKDERAPLFSDHAA